MCVSLDQNKIKDFVYKKKHDDVFKFSLAFFVIGLIVQQRIDILGQLFLGEIISILFIFINYKKIIVLKSIKPLFLWALVWAVAQTFSDIYNQTPLSDAIKGVGSPILLMLTILGLSMFFIRHFYQMPSFLVGATIGVLPSFFLFNPFFAQNPWKWGFGSLVLNLFALYFTFFAKRKSNLLLITFLVVFAFIGLANSSRSEAMFPIFAALAFILLRLQIFNSLLSLFRGRFSIINLLCVIAVFIIVVNSIFTAVFTSSWISDYIPQQSAEEWKRQGGGEYGILLGGRVEMLASFEAFIEKPLLGHGSWAKDPNGYYHDLIMKRRFEMGYLEKEVYGDQYKSLLLPTHSYLIGALVYAGIGGGLFWLYLMGWLLFEFVQKAHQLGFYFYFKIISLLWAIFFSPFGASSRWSTALFIAVFAVYSTWLSTNKFCYDIKQSET